MKTLIHKRGDTIICIYEHNDTFLKGSFFKEKPENGDYIMSHQKREANFLYVYEVKAILKNRDSVIQKECTHNNKKAYFELELENITDKIGPDIDNSLSVIH